MKRILLLSAAFLAVAAGARAETRLRVTGRVGTHPIHVDSFGSGGAAQIFTQTLINDLKLQGSFEIVSSRGEANVSGSVSGSGNGVSASGRLELRGQDVLNQTVTGNQRRAAHELADLIVEKITGEPGIASTRVAFISKKTGNKEVYVMDYDGGNAVKLTSDRSICGSPAISRDGSTVAYTSYKSGYPDVYVQTIGSGSRSRIAAFPGLNSGAAFSPEGGELALTLSKDGNPELYTCSRGGGGFNRLTRTRGAESGPSWSPDGSKIVYSYDGNGLPQIYVTSAGGGGASQLTRGGYNTEPTWAPRSALIAYSQRSGGGFNIMAMNPDGSGITTYTTGEHPSWGPDGRHLVFARSGTVYLLDVLTGHSTPIRGDLGDCSEPSWSGTVR